jgi:segregation and condensation protein A
MTVAVTLFALLELYKRGEVDWEQDRSFGEIDVHAPSPRVAAGSLSLAGAGRPGAGAPGAAARLAG